MKFTDEEKLRRNIEEIIYNSGWISGEPKVTVQGMAGQIIQLITGSTKRGGFHHSSPQEQATYGKGKKGKDMGMNPDNPTKCPYLMSDGVHCWEKTIQFGYETDFDPKKTGGIYVKCPFIVSTKEGTE